MVKKTPLQRTKILSKSKKHNLKRKNRDYTLSNQAIEFGWDKTLSKTQNYAKFGLTPTINVEESRLDVAIKTLPDEKFAYLPDVGEERGSKFNTKRVTYGEQKYLDDLTEKYGEDYEKMTWDLKLNPYQETASQLRKRIQKLREWRAIEAKEKEEKEKQPKPEEKKEEKVEELDENGEPKKKRNKKKKPKKRLFKKIL